MSNHHCRHQAFCLFVILATLLLGTGCGATVTSAHAPKALPDAVATQKATRPTVVRVKGELWVVGLPPNHGWTLGKRVLLTKHDNDKGLDLKVGVVTILDDGYATAAPVGIVYEEPGQSFDGARAEIVKGDRRIRLGRGFGRLTAPPNMGTVEIDLGQQDGVAIGDVYEVRSAAGTKGVGRVKISQVGPATSKASVLNRAAFTIGLEVVYQPRSDGDDQSSLLRILVCDFAPKADEKEVVLAGKRFAGELATHLREASESWSGLTVVQASQLVANDNEARALGKAYPADIVVWGTAMCVESQGCALPVFTVVEPARLALGRMRGREIGFDLADPGKGLERGTAKDPSGLVFGLLGELAYDAQRYGDAVFYLERVPLGAMEGGSGFRVRRDLGTAQYVLGRIESALGTAAKLEAAARREDRGWEMVGVGQQAEILAESGQIEEALRFHGKALGVYEAIGDRRSHAVTLGAIARILANKGELEKALKLHDEALGVFQALGDQRSRAITLGGIAGILVTKGNTDEALRLHREELRVYETLDDRRSRAVTLGAIARILVDKGEIDEALKLNREALGVYEALGDRRSRAVLLTEIGRILVEKGDWDEALRLLREALIEFDGLGDRRSRALALGDIARIFSARGQVDEALKLFQEKLAISESLDDRSSRAVTLGEIARILTNKGEVGEALNLLREKLAVTEALGDRRSRAATLSDVARILIDKGEVGEALKLYREALGVFEAVGDRRAHAVTLVEIARILADQGDKDRALKLYREALGVFEALDDRRSRAVTLGDIAEILVTNGEVDEGLKLYREGLEVYEALGDKRSKSATLLDVARLYVERKDVATALPMLRESYEIAVAQGDAYGIAIVGEALATLLIKIGSSKEAAPIVESASAALVKIGKADDAAALRALLTSPPKTP